MTKDFKKISIDLCYYFTNTNYITSDIKKKLERNNKNQNRWSDKLATSVKTTGDGGGRGTRGREAGARLSEVADITI